MRPETDHCPDENSMEGIERNEVSDAAEKAVMVMLFILSNDGRKRGKLWFATDGVLTPSAMVVLKSCVTKKCHRNYIVDVFLFE